MERQLSYITTNSYSILNEKTRETKNIWIAFHGLGYLSRFFINYFKDFNVRENYIIAPQAPSKYYQKNFKYVGACWLTRENTQREVKNILKYLNVIYNKEIIPLLEKKNSLRLILLGYSQGVSIMLRWMAINKIISQDIIIHSGGIPTELTCDDFKFLPSSTRLHWLCGKKDEYLDRDRIKKEIDLCQKLFSNKVNTVLFEGRHEVSIKELKKIVK